MIDLGVRLESERRSIVDELASGSPEDWDPLKVASISARHANARVKGPPEKRVYGSDFAFRDVGQLRGIHANQDVNDAVVSAAYGGFSSVWGSQIMPFTRATLDTWPIGADEMEPHYRAVLNEIDVAGQAD